MLKTLVLCADDFGQAPHISQAILTLAEQDRLSAISCMSTEEDWQQQGKDLKVFHKHLNIGLHFNLTWGSPFPPSPTSWLFRSFTGRIDRAFIEAHLIKQLDQFEAVTGFPPDFIDGHQHVHSFPLIRDSLVKVIAARFPKKKPYVRTLCPMLSAQDARLKAFIIRGAAFRFSQKLAHHEIPHNSCFGGVYSLTETAPYRRYMQKWLHKAPSGTLLMCHPGKKPLEGTVDPIQEARLQEYLYLLSPSFTEDCLTAGVKLGKLSG